MCTRQNHDMLCYNFTDAPKDFYRGKWSSFELIAQYISNSKNINNKKINIVVW